MAEGARLESVFTRKGNVGSNPTLSATTSLLSNYFLNIPSLTKNSRFSQRRSNYLRGSHEYLETCERQRRLTL